MYRMLGLLLAGLVSAHALTASADEIRSETHKVYVKSLWDYVQNSDYQNWPQLTEPVGIGVGPILSGRTFVQSAGHELAAGSIVISEQWFGDELGGISFFMKQKSGYSSKNRDWYWVHYLPDGTVVSASPDRENYRRPGFVTWMKEGRLWVFLMTTPEAADFLRSGELAKSVTRPAAGPDRVSVRSADSETIDAYLASKDGFVAWPVEGRFWIHRSDDPSLAAFVGGAEPAKVVIRPGAGPNGETLKATDSETLDAYLK